MDIISSTIWLILSAKMIIEVKLHGQTLNRKEIGKAEEPQKKIHSSNRQGQKKQVNPLQSISLSGNGLSQENDLFHWDGAPGNSLSYQISGSESEQSRHREGRVEKREQAKK